ncbi:MAG: ABC transporter ATP-binding protein [Candidatus Omnitrophota bacterium]
MGSILKIQNLSYGYDSRKILHNINFTIAKGEFIGIIGPNGAGKSTLFRTISRVLKPWQGNIIYKEKDIACYLPQEFAKEVAVIPQILEVPFGFSVEEFILMGRFPHIGRFSRLKAEDYKILNNILNLTDTYSLKDRKLFELSGGERQRVILGQGFAQEPSLLLLDEPTSHLDIAHQIHLLDLIKKMNRDKGLTVIIVFHDLNLASSYCKRLLLLNEGRIFKDGTPSEVLTYQNIEDVYKTIVVLKKNPINNKPYVLLATKEDLEKRKKLKKSKDTSS